MRSLLLVAVLLLGEGAALSEPVTSLGRGVRARRWRYIVVHHTATAGGDARSIDAHHRNVRHMWRGLAYHFVIGNGHGQGDGVVVAGTRWTRQEPGAHVASKLLDPSGRHTMDDVAIGIALIGNLEDAPPTIRQRRALGALVQELRERYRIPAGRVMGHGEVPGAHTLCPGARLSLDFLRSE